MTTKIVNVPARSKTLIALLKKASKTNLLLRSVDGEEFLLAKVAGFQDFFVGDSDDFEEEIKATRANKKLMKFLDKRRAQVRPGQGIRIKEVRKQLGLD